MCTFFVLKVIEVNSSSKRGGKYILSEFQEATQSHQVTGKRASSETHQSLTLVSKTVPPISENNNYNSSKKVTKRRKKRSDKEVKGEKKERKTKRLLETLRIKEVPGRQMSLILLDEVRQ